jgi:hypothetical protein
MAKFVATDFKISLNGTDLSQSIHSATLDISANEVESTTFGNTYKTVVGGIVSGSVKLDFYQDYAAGAVDAVIWPLINTLATVTITPTSATVSATNPKYTATVLVNAYQPVNANIGDLAGFSVTWPTSGTVVRGTV